MRTLITAATLLAVFAAVASADDITNSHSAQPRLVEIATFNDFTDFGMFQGAFGAPLNRIRFDEVPVGTIVSNDFAGLGAIFTDGNDATQSSGTFVEDGVGLSGAGRIHVSFSQPARAVGAFYPGALTIEIFDTENGTSLHTSVPFGGAGTGFFGGVVSDQDFGFVELRDHTDDTVFIDDLVFGFAPPEDGVFGCIEVNGIPLALNVVVMVQRQEPRQFVLSDENGCYLFTNPVPGKWFSIFILGTVFPEPALD